MNVLSERFEKSCIFVFIIACIAALFLSLNVWLLSSNLPHYSNYDKHRMVELALFAIGTLWLIVSPIRQQKVIALIACWPKWVWLSVFTFFLLGLASAAYSASPKTALQQVALYTEMGFVTILLASLRVQNKKEFDEAAMSTFLVSWIIYVLVVVYMVLAAIFYMNHSDSSFIGFRNSLTHPFFDYIRFFTELVTISLPLMVLPLWQRRLKPWVQVLAWLFLICMWCLFWAQQSRGLGLAAIVAAAYCLICFRRKAFGFLWRHAIAMIISAPITWFLLHWNLKIAVRPVASLAQSARIGEWHHALSIITNKPWLGIGPGNYNLSTHIGQISHPDNSGLLIASEWGIIACILFVALVCWAWFKQTSLTCRESDNPKLSIALSASLVAVLVHAQFSGFLLFPATQLFLVLIFGWMLGAGKFSTSPMTNNFNLRLTLIILALASLAALAYGIYPLITQLPAIEQHTIQNCHCALSPGFWQIGHVAEYS